MSPQCENVIQNLDEKLNKFYQPDEQLSTENQMYSSYGLFSVIVSMMSMLKDDKKQKLMEVIAGHNGVKRPLPLCTEAEIYHNVVSNASITEIRTVTKIWADDHLNNERQQNDPAEVITKVPFTDHPKKAMNVINSWISNQTNGKIKQFLQITDIDESTKLIITNALTFFGTWKYPFYSEHTTKRSFHINSTSTVQVETMATTLYTSYKQTERIKVVEIPYKDSNISMYIVMSANDEKLLYDSNELEKILTTDMNEKTKIKLFLPKFKFTTKNKLKRLLVKIGLEDLFSQIDNGVFKNENLYFDDVTQKMHIIVDEIGTQASAGSGATAVGRSMPFRLMVDKPFGVIIRDRMRHINIFHGQINNPSWVE